jgi:ubiquinol-cytochrome c reductase cytochrome b subunit
MNPHANLPLMFSVPRTRAIKRIGPHNIDILSIIIGSLLGDAYAEKHGLGTRICFQQEGNHSAYLFWLHSFVSELGYCNKKIPALSSRLSKSGKLRYVLRFKTFTFRSFDWIQEAFYPEGKKVVPVFIQEYLSPLALAIWVMDDAAKVSSGIKLCTDGFVYKDVEFLSSILREKYGLKTSINKTGVINQYCIYISKSSIEEFYEIVKPYLHPSMKYKFGK